MYIRLMHVHRSIIHNLDKLSLHLYLQGAFSVQNPISPFAPHPLCAVKNIISNYLAWLSDVYIHVEQISI